MARPRLLAAAAAAALLVALAPPAPAALDEGLELDDVGATTLRAGEMKAGWDVVAIGIAGRAQLGTAWLLDLFGALNVTARVTAWRTDRVALGAEVGYVWFDPRTLGQDRDYRFRVVPLRLTATAPLTASIRVHSRLSWLRTRARGEVDALGVALYRQLGPLGTLTLDATAELRTNDQLAFLAGFRLPIAGGRLEDVEVAEDVEEGLRPRANWRLEGSMLLSWQSFFLRLGVGYGSSFLGLRQVFPVADVYWRF